MQELRARQVNPELKEIVAEASRALARLDAPRLEELALSCQALNQALNQDASLLEAGEKRELLYQTRQAAGDMAVFARVLEATRANLRVMNRLRELRASRLEYSERQARGWTRTESGNGDD